MGRLVELKHEMSDLEKTEFKPFDDILQDLKITPDDVSLSVPRYYNYGRSESFTVRQKVLHQMIEQMDSESKKTGTEKPSMNLDEATKILQMHERARQGRLRAKFMWELSMEEERKRKISKGNYELIYHHDLSYFRPESTVRRRRSDNGSEKVAWIYCAAKDEKSAIRGADIHWNAPWTDEARGD